MEAWKHENILPNYNHVDLYFKSESTSVAYKHSKEEYIEITTCMVARVTWKHENVLSHLLVYIFCIPKVNQH